MTKNEYQINFNYYYDSTRNGAKYSFDGLHWLNSGEFLECVDKMSKGLECKKDANTAYDAGSDIEETNTSVKSGKATLTSKVLGNTYSEIKTTYFKNVHSNNWDWVVMVDDTITIYNMNKAEFSEFMDNWAGFDNHRKIIRFKTSSGKMIKWLEERV